MNAELHEAALRRALDHLNRGNLDGYLDLYTEDAVLYGYGLEPGRAPLRQFYEGFLAAFPDTHIAIDDLLAAGDKVACRYRFSGTHRGDFMGVPATGRSVEIAGITVLRFVGGRCAERWAQADFLGLLQQLGAVPDAQAAPVDPAALARTIYDFFSNGVFEQVIARATEDIEVHFVPAEQTFHGHDGMLMFMQGFKTAFPDVTLEVTRQVASGDQLVNEFVARGTHTGPLMTPAGAVPPTGRRAEWRVCEVWTVRDGKVASIANYQDSATLMRQLGQEEAV